MSRSKPPLSRLHEMTPGQAGDFFVLLAERTRAATRDGKPFMQVQTSSVQLNPALGDELFRKPGP